MGLLGPLERKRIKSLYVLVLVDSAGNDAGLLHPYLFDDIDEARKCNPQFEQEARKRGMSYRVVRFEAMADVTGRVEGLDPHERKVSPAHAGILGDEP